MDLLFVTKVIAALLLPPGGIILLMLAGFACFRRQLRVALMLFIVATLALYLLSAGPVVSWMAAPLERTAVLSMSEPRLADRQAIVVLGGGRRRYAPEYGGETVSALSLERLRYGARLQRELNLPLAVTGGVVPYDSDAQSEAELMARVLREDFGRPARWVETRSRTTHENAAFTRKLLGADDVRRIILVSHAIHLPRAAPEFIRQGFDVLLAPTAFYTGASVELTFRHWLPSTGALFLSWYALHEYLGRLWYWIRY
jgi:uncharacterized SAM-binding protein YcdF (DUF218 family)